MKIKSNLAPVYLITFLSLCLINHEIKTQDAQKPSVIAAAPTLPASGPGQPDTADSTKASPTLDISNTNKSTISDTTAASSIPVIPAARPSDTAAGIGALSQAPTVTTDVTNIKPVDKSAGASGALSQTASSAPASANIGASTIVATPTTSPVTPPGVPIIAAAEPGAQPTDLPTTTGQTAGPTAPAIVSGSDSGAPGIAPTSDAALLGTNTGNTQDALKHTTITITDFANTQQQGADNQGPTRKTSITVSKYAPKPAGVSATSTPPSIPVVPAAPTSAPVADKTKPGKDLSKDAAKDSAAKGDKTIADKTIKDKSEEKPKETGPYAGITIKERPVSISQKRSDFSMADVPLSEEELEAHEDLPEVSDIPTTASLSLIKDMGGPSINQTKEFSVKSMADIPQSEEEHLAQKQQILGVPEAGLSPSRKAQDVLSTETKKASDAGSIYLGKYAEPWQGLDPNETMQMNFENKELREFLKFLEDQLKVTFILNDDLQPTPQDLANSVIGGIKISFTSHSPLTLRQAWEIGLTFLEMAGLTPIPTTLPRTYHITASKPNANASPLPTFIGTDPELLPNNDIKVRYVYFVENADLTTIAKVIEALQSGTAAAPILFPNLRGILITDRSASIKSIIQVLRELDRVTMPETLSILRLKHADAQRIVDLYQKLIGKDKEQPFNPFMRQRKPTTTQYFNESTRMFAEPFTNSLIILGTKDNIKKLENFILKEIDKESDLPFAPLHIVQLKFIDAASLADILNNVISEFNKSHPEASRVGGTRDGNKFFRPSVKVTAEPSGNRLIINSNYEEYLKIRETIDKLDVEQPQVAIKVLILNVDLTNLNQLGTQLRNARNCCDESGTNGVLGNNINFQYSGLGQIITRDTVGVGDNATPVNGAERLLGNLLTLANAVPSGTGASISPFGPGSTLVTLGRDIFGIFGLLRVLQTFTRTSVIANPFLVTTHKYKAEIKVGETRRTVSALVQGANRETRAESDLDANLIVRVTPQISYDDMVTLNIYIELSQFTESTDPALPTIISRKISTEALLANREVIALGGLIRDRTIETQSKVPILGDIPLLGWFFKSKTKEIERNSLLILISPEIIKPFDPEVAKAYTFTKINDAKETLFGMTNKVETRDPIHRWFFADHKDKESKAIDKFVSIQQRYIDESQRARVQDSLNASSTGVSETGFSTERGTPGNKPKSGVEAPDVRPVDTASTLALDKKRANNINNKANRRPGNNRRKSVLDLVKPKDNRGASVAA